MENIYLTNQEYSDRNELLSCHCNCYIQNNYNCCINKQILYRTEHYFIMQCLIDDQMLYCKYINLSIRGSVNVTKTSMHFLIQESTSLEDAIQLTKLQSQLESQL